MALKFKEIIMSRAEHMPYLAKWGSKPLLLFCRADENKKFPLQQVTFSEELLKVYPVLRNLPPRKGKSKEVRPWQAYYQNGVTAQAIDLPEPFDIVCSPVCWPGVDGETLTLSWVGGKMGQSGMIYHLYTGYWQPDKPVTAGRKLYRTSVGFSTPLLKVWLRPQNELWLSDGRVAKMETFRVIYRTCPIWNDPGHILVTGDNAGRMVTHRVNLSTGEARELYLNGKPVYKSSLMGDEVMAAIKDPTGDESHHLEQGRAEWREAPAVQFIKVSESDQERAWPSKAKKISGCCDSAKNYER
jgi:hypothetical protein